MTIPPAINSCSNVAIHRKADLGLQVDRRHRQEDNSRVWYPLTDSELTKIVVRRHQHASIRMCSLQNLPISWVSRPVSNTLDIVACRSEYDPGRLPDAGIHQKFQRGPSTKVGMKRSLATIL